MGTRAALAEQGGAELALDRLLQEGVSEDRQCRETGRRVVEEETQPSRQIACARDHELDRERRQLEAGEQPDQSAGAEVVRT